MLMFSDELDIMIKKRFITVVHKKLIFCYGMGEKENVPTIFEL